MARFIRTIHDFPIVIPGFIPGVHGNGCLPGYSCSMRKLPIPLLTTSEMAEADRLTIEGGKPGILLMENAGRAVAEAVHEHHAKCNLVVLCGPGNNGGDGFIAARLLRDWGWQVTLFLLGTPERLTGDAAQAAHRWAGPIHPMTADACLGAELVIDAIFGAGLARDIDGVVADIIGRVNGADIQVVAVDVPTGLDGNTGQVRGHAFQAFNTVTFFKAKPGHYLMPGRLLCGKLNVADIGMAPETTSRLGVKCFLNTPTLWGATFPRPALDTHKYKRGHALVVSGDMTHTGAARLAARASLRAGAGLVTVASPSDALATNAAQLTAIMLMPFQGADGLTAILDDKRKNACLIGPGAGVGAATRENVLATLLSGAALVLDADALTSFAEIPRDLFVAIKGYFAGPVVMTPHEGEFDRLFPDLANPALGKCARAKAAAQASGAVMVLKGPDTVIAAPDGRLAINANAGPELATAGSGDVLSGIILALLAQGMAPFEAATAGVWLHGEAGSHFGPGLVAEDLPEMLPAVLRDLLSALS